jgi:DNA-binding transcriptional LysR family regulator
MRFDLIDLRLFANIHDAGTITGGAEATHMTLASASERIRALEDSLGVPLLLRERRGVKLTPAGLALLHHARLMLQQMERLQGDLGEYGAGLRGHVRMLCNTAAMSEYLPEILAGFLMEHPGISIDLEEQPSDVIVDAVRSGLCDPGMVSDAADPKGLQTFAFRRDPLSLIVPKGHPAAARTSISFEEVIDLWFVGLVEGSALQDHLGQHARRIGRRLNYRIRLRSLEAICRMVGRGVGVAIVPQTVAARCGRSAGIQRIRLCDPWAQRKLMVCVRNLEALPNHSQLMV